MAAGGRATAALAELAAQCDVVQLLVVNGDCTPLSAVNIFVKDLGIVLDAARRMALPLPLPLAAAAHQLHRKTAAAGHGAEDDAAVIKFYAELAGLELPQAPSPQPRAERPWHGGAAHHARGHRRRRHAGTRRPRGSG